MDAQRPFLSFPVLDLRAVYELTSLCAELQKDVITLQCQIMELEQQVILNRDNVGNIHDNLESLIAMRDTLNSVFVLETEPAAVCPECHGEGSDFSYICERCNGTGKVQS